MYREKTSTPLKSIIPSVRIGFGTHPNSLIRSDRKGMAPKRTERLSGPATNQKA